MSLLPLTAGPLTMVFDIELGWLRYVRAGETELLRGLFAAIRDADWNTLAFRVDDLQVEQNHDSFSLHFQANGLGGDPPFQWSGQITGSSAGVVEFHFRGTAVRTFLRNRIGLCVLHPTENCAGQACHIEHVDGSNSHGVFPRLISPHQPFRNIRAIFHRVSAGFDFRVTMLGDTFEMEDQRNWTDASFKTYSTPLALPFPVEVLRATIIEQVVKLELTGTVVSAPKLASVLDNEPLRLTIDWSRPRHRPPLGFSLAPSAANLPAAVSEQLRRMQPDHLRVDLWLDQPEWQEELRAGIDLSRVSQSRLELALFFNPPYSSQLRDLATALEQDSAEVARVLLFAFSEKVTPPELLQAAQTIWARVDSKLPLVVGTNAYFAELNRDRPTNDGGNPVCYSINPQVHAFDNLSIAETLAAQAATVDTAVDIFGSDVVISPVTLRPRFNPNATTQLDRRLELAAANDPRQSTGFAAAWTVGVLASLGMQRRVSSLTLFETHGPRGIMGEAGQPYALTSLLQTVLKSQNFFSAAGCHPLHVVGLGVQQRDQSRQVLLGNTSDRPRVVEIWGATQACQRVEMAAESVRIIPWEERVDA